MAIAIALYEEERLRLNSLIDECLNDFEGPDYLLADFHQRALFQVNRVLQILNNFDDEWYDRKKFITEHISRLKKELDNDKSDIFKPWLKGMIERKSKELEELYAKPKAVKEPGSDSILDDALADLVYRKIKKFKLIYNRAKNLCLEFSASKQQVKITIQSIKHHIKNRVLYDSDLDALQKLGFYFVNRNKLTVAFSDEPDVIIRQIKTILLSVVFKIFSYYYEKNQSFIEFEH